MRMIALLAVLALSSGLGLVTAAPIASAENPVMTDGQYTYADEDGVVAMWSIATTCSPGCVAHVSTGPGQGFDAPLVNGRYAVKRVVPEGAFCPPYVVGETLFGSTEHPVHVYQWWNPVTLAGEVDFLETSAPCGLHDLRDSFTLTRIN